METLLSILNELHPETDFAHETRLIDDGVLVSFDIVMLITRIEEAFGVIVPAKEIKPQNFNSAEALFALITRLSEQDD